MDFFVLDEFYKLSLDRDDERAIVLNEALYKLLKKTNHFYMLGPMIKSIPDTFQKKYNVHWEQTYFSTVAIDELDLGIKPKTKEIDRGSILFDLLAKLKEPTLIYCSSPQRATDLSAEFIKYMKSNGISIRSNYSTQNKDIAEWIEENIHPDWVLIDALRNGVAFHHGAIPRHLGSSIVDSFNGMNIKYLFCTSTLIEGVNTAAKNVILYDKRKGLKEIDFFDYRNIAGRSGRMKQYYIGNVYRFHDEPEQMMLDVDIPIITQKSAPVELLMHIDEDELLPESSLRIKNIGDIDNELRDVLMMNAGISVEGQLEVVKILERDLNKYSNLLQWTSYPQYEQLQYIIKLAWEHLINRKESKGGVRTHDQLTYYTMTYSMVKSIKGLIKKDINSRYWLDKEPIEKNRVNKIVFFILNAVRHWFDYKLPKLIGTMSNLQDYVFKKHGRKGGDYSFLAFQLENGFSKANLAGLVEYDIPISAIHKLGTIFKEEIEIEDVMNELKRMDLEKIGLNKYEIKKLKAII